LKILTVHIKNLIPVVGKILARVKDGGGCFEKLRRVG